MPAPSSLQPQYYLGIDPGQNGGIAVVDQDGNCTSLVRMPETEQDILCAIPYGDTITLGTIEKVHSMPGQGVSSTFKFGCGYGGLRMAMVALAIKFDEVPPQRWQKALGVVPRDTKTESKRDHKTKLLAKAQQLFPNTNITRHTADALLIAEYTRRKCLGLL